MKYKFLILFILILFINAKVVATSNSKNLNQNLIDEFLETAKEYSNEIFPELENGEVLEKIIKGDAFKTENIIERILGLFTKEICVDFWWRRVGLRYWFWRLRSCTCK